MNKKIKVVWLCHFSNKRIQEKLNLKKHIPEFSPWITMGIEEAKKRKDIELHIISPHLWISKDREFIEDNIFYHFFNPGIPCYGRHWPRFFRFDFYTNFFINRYKINKYVDKIIPHIVHFHGTENAYFTISFFDLVKKFPLLVTIQGLISTIERYSRGNKIINHRIKVEKNILCKAKNFGVRTKEMICEINKYNTNANFFWHEYFINDRNKHAAKKTEKKYDIIFFARLSIAKGIEDLITATGVLKRDFPNINVAVIGTTNPNYMNRLNKLVIENSCKDNINFLGYFEAQNDVHKILLESKICVLPVYEDTIPGTIIESMLLKIPVVTYETGGIPSINENDNYIEIVEKGDIKGLSGKIKVLLESKNKRIKLANKAYNYSIKRWDNRKALSDIMIAYREILKNDIKK